MNVNAISCRDLIFSQNIILGSPDSEEFALNETLLSSPCVFLVFRF